MNNIDKLHLDAAIEKIQEGINKRGFQCVTIISGEDAGLHPYHYSVGLSGMGFAEIFISGRLPQNVAYSFIEQMVEFWKKEKGVVLGKFGPFSRLVEKVAPKLVGRKATTVGHFPAVAKQRNGTIIPMTTVWVSVEEKRKQDPEFMKFLYAFYPEKPDQFVPVVQLLWPDEFGILPDSDNYTKNEEYKQELLPAK